LCSAGDEVRTQRSYNSFESRLHGVKIGSAMIAIGMMSGTSMDGIDLALLDTDGERVVELGPVGGRSYTKAERDLLREAVAEAAFLMERDARPNVLTEAEDLITETHAEAVNDFLRENGLTPDQIDVVGFHGQTVLHRPEDRLTVQLGDGQRLADLTGIKVVYDFRANDVAQGGQGAPFVPAYHRALARASELALPAAIVNIGGVANVTWIGPDGELIAFDTGPGNALIDDWMRQKTGDSRDENGALAAQGQADSKRLEAMLRHPYFLRKPPKSLDRNAFPLSAMEGLSPADGAATLTGFTAASLVMAIAHFPMPPEVYVVVGGGAHNQTLMSALGKLLPGRLLHAQELGWSADSIEAEAFAFLAVRSLLDLPLSFPGTTGVPEPAMGGLLAYPASPPDFRYDDIAG
jgi:anhydro-N-acetylmuramic acid kinase